MSANHPPHSQSGQTLIEVLVTALIVGLVAAATATALIATAHASGDQRRHATADVLASQDQERMRSLSDAQLAALGGSGQRRTSVAQGVTYTITSTTAAVSANGAGSCSGQSAADFEITSTVTWQSVAGSAQQSVTANSLVARPTTGDLLASATDQTGAALPGVSVVATENDGQGDDAQSGTTDQNGCTLFAGLTPGTYQVTFSRLGYVDQTGDATPSFPSVQVTATGTPTQNAVVMGQAGTIKASLVTPADTAGNLLAGDGDYVSEASTAKPTPRVTAAQGPGQPTPVGGLFPFDTGQGGAPSYTGNYAVWAGRCPQQEPTTGVTAASVPPGGDVATNVTEPALDLTAVTVGGQKVTPTRLVFTFAALTSPACTDTWSSPVASAASAGVPASGNWLQFPGQPFANGISGTLTVCAEYPGLLGTTRSGSTTTTNVNMTVPRVETPLTIAITRLGAC